MEFEQRADQRFQDLLDGRSAAASVDLARLATVAGALRPSALPAASPAFKRRLRSELLARASMTEEDIFAAVLDGAPVDVPSEMRPLVAVASALRGDAQAMPSPAFRFQLRNALTNRAQARGSLAQRATAWVGGTNLRLQRRTRLVAVLGMTMAMMLGTSIVFAAASNSLPGDALYGVKTLHENIRIAVLSGEPEGRAHLGFARERLDEIEGLRDRGESDSVLYIDTLERMDRSTTSGAAILLEVFERTGDRAPVEFVSEFAALQVKDLSALVSTLPPGVRPAARDSLSLAQRTADQAQVTLIGCGACSDDAMFRTPITSGRGRNATPTCACPQQDTPQESRPGRPAVDDPSPDRPIDPSPPPPPPPAVDLPDETPDQVELPAEDLLDELVDIINQPIPDSGLLPDEIPTPHGLLP